MRCVFFLSRQTLYCFSYIDFVQYRTVKETDLSLDDIRFENGFFFFLGIRVVSF